VQVRALSEGGETTALFVARRATGHEPSSDVLLRLPALGYKPPNRTAVGRFLIEQQHPGKVATEWWVGWPFADLPLLEREPLSEQWSKSEDEFLERPSPAQPRAPLEDALVIWVRSILVSADLQLPSGAGQGKELHLPIL
jgi:hypothetical protein